MSSVKKYKVLLLNADFTPEKFISWQTAIVQVVTASKNAAYVVEYFNKWVILDSSRRKHKIPAVMALKKYVDIGNRKSPYTKGNVYVRDLMTCQYCGEGYKKYDLTVDHVIPSSRWKSFGMPGHSSCFENVVTACKSCNSRKGDKTPEEASMPLISAPRAVTRREIFRNKIGLMEDIPNEWRTYLTGIISETN